MTTLRLPAIATFIADDLSQAPHLRKHFLGPRAAETQNEALANICAYVSGRKRPQPKTLLRRAPRNPLIGQTWRQRDYQVHAGFRAQDIDLGAELLAQRLRERATALR